ncbi:hypothetical protein J4232_06340 [Candidatus Woesearchaeota archaeon]|nr:hypothetical protein [Candidatus Woesearchaeota archaeon]
MQLDDETQNLIERINQIHGLSNIERINSEYPLFDFTDNNSTKQMLSVYSKLDFDRVLAIRNSLYEGLYNDVLKDFAQKHKNKFNIIDVYFIVDDSQLSDYQRRNKVIASLLDLIDKQDIIHGDDIVLPYISDDKNLWDSKRKGFGDTFENNIRKQLLAKGFPEIYGYSDASLSVEISKYLLQRNYLAAAVYIALFEDKVLIGDSDSNPKTYAEGVLEYFVKSRNKKETDVPEDKKKMAVIVRKEYMLSHGAKDFCKKHDLGYVVLEVR